MNLGSPGSQKGGLRRHGLRGSSCCRLWMNPMELFCPTCLHPIDLDLPEAAGDESDGLRTKDLVTSVHCPNCGLVQLPARDETMSWSAKIANLAGKTVAHFSLTRLLGQGASGHVWLADDTMLQRKVALKLPQSMRGDIAGLLREAQTAAHLRHANIVSVYEVGSEEGQVFIASEYIEGLTLRDFLSSGTPTNAKTAELVAAVARALHHAHEQGIVHRDVKPSNILVNAEGQPFVTDFGLAKRISHDETISSEGQILGTARYMSPEQASGKTRETDQRSDIYAIGVILFEMLTGHLPYRGNVRALLHQKVYEDAPSPRKLVPTIPKDLETICLRCLERDSSRRYASAQEVADELQRFRKGEPIKARPISSLERGWRWCRRRPAVASLLASLILSLSAGLAGVSYYSWQAEKSAELTRRSLYRSQMNLAAEYYEKGDISGVRQMLDRVATDDRMSALPGFEWRYFDHLTTPFVQIVNQGDAVSDVAVSPTGDLLAAIGVNNKSIRVWSGKTGETIRTLSLPAGRFSAIDFSPNSGCLLSGSTDGKVRIWDPLESDETLLEIKHGPPVTLVRYSPTGERFLSAGSRGAVRIRDVDTKSLVAEIPAGKSGAKDARFSPDGKSIAIGAEDGRVRMWNIGSGMTTGDLEPDPNFENLAFSDDGLTIVTGSYGGLIRIWSVSDGTLRHTYDMDSGRIGDLEFVKGTPLLVALASDGRLHLYDTADLAEVRKLKTHNLTDGRLARSGDGGFLAVGSGDGSIKLVRADLVIQPNTFWHEQHVRAVDFLSDGRRLVAADGGGAVRIWDVEKGESLDLSDGPAGEIAAASVQRHGDLVAVADIGRKVYLWDGESGDFIQTIHVPESEIVDIAFSSSGRYLAVATRLGGCFVYESGDWNEPRLKIAGREIPLHALAFSPDDLSIVVSYEDGEVVFVSATDARPRPPSVHVPSIPLALAFCEAGGLLAIGTDSGEIHLYDLQSQNTRSIIKGHTSRVNTLATLPDGMTLVSGGRDKELKLWDTSSGELLTTLSGHVRQVFSISVSPDGQTIASGGLEGDIRVWRSQPGD